MQKYLFKDILIVNEGKIECTDVLIKGDRIEKISPQINEKGNVQEIPGEKHHLFPGVIDDQVHFREPGLTHKADIGTESRAAVAGGVTTFMEMPNTIPNALTLELLQDKYDIAAKTSAANYSFFMGISNTNAEIALRANELKEKICGLKIFMGSSTGNMLVDNHATLNRIFSESELLIATHCEDERIIKRNYEHLKSIKPDLEPADHPIIRDSEACYESSLTAIQLAKKYNSRLHILHISTEKELQLFGNMLPLKDKRITAEVCVHHLHYTANDYAAQGYKIKCNPAIKVPENKAALWKALLDDRLDVIATDHAPHLLSEKMPPYEQAHSGLPLVQHSLQLMLQYYYEGRIPLVKIAEKMSHAVADCFQIKDRGYIREGYFADLVMVNLDKKYRVTPENILYKCGWSPLENVTFNASIEKTMVSGNIVYENDRVSASHAGQRISFNR
jgi:dihydroorotase